MVLCFCYIFCPSTLFGGTPMNSTSLVALVPLLASTLSATQPTLEKLTIEEKVPLLFMISDYGDEELLHREGFHESLEESAARIDRIVSEKMIGGILFKGQWTPTGLKERIRHLKSISKTNLIFAQDVEWGLAQRHDGVVGLPKALCMGAIGDEALLNEWASAIADTAKSVGITLILGPVADVNSNPNNPIINDRSFGDNPEQVAKRVCRVIRAFQERGMAACAKHFPGHGNTSKDSHTDLPSITATMDELAAVELVPFKEAINCGVDCVMTAHIALPSTESSGLPASLSPFWIRKVLREQLRFQDDGVVITDDLIMAGARGNRSIEETVRSAVMAGNDMCILSKEIDECMNHLVDSVKTGKIPEKEIDIHARRILHLQTKYAGQGGGEPPSLASLVQLHDKLYENALTCIGEPFSFSPKSTLIVHVGSVPLSTMVQKLSAHYPDISIAMMRKKPRSEEVAGVIRALEGKKEALVVLCDLDRFPSLQFGLTPELIKGLEEIAKTGCTLRYIIFASPYVLRLLPQPVSSALVAYEKTQGSEKAVFQALLDTFTLKGRLPVKIES